MLEYIKLILLGSAKAYQFYMTNESYKTDSNNIEIYIILYYLIS